MTPPTAEPTAVDVLLIGGGVAAASAAAELRARGFDGSVLLVTRELDPPYHRPPVTKELLGGACERAALQIYPDDWWEANDVELRTRCAVMALDPAAHTATLAGRETIAYRHALVATGAMVRRLALDGAQLEGIHYLRTPGNALALREQLADAERIAIVGGSFVAVEVAATLTRLGKRCTLVMEEALPLERAFGPTLGRWTRQLLVHNGIELVGGERVTAFSGGERVEAVVTASGGSVPADLVVVGVGAIPDVALARRAGLELGESGGIRCDARLRTSAPDVYAAGDACEYDSVLHGRRVRIEHEEHAIAQGRTVARNIVGEQVEHDVVPYFWSDLADWATVEHVGVASGCEHELLSGDPAAGEPFTLWRLDGARRVVGAVTVGRSDDVARARELVVARAPAAELGHGLAVAG